MITSYDPQQQKDVKVTAKHKAQEQLMRALQIAFVQHMDGHSTHGMTQREAEMVWQQMDKQMARIEKLFGYEPNSWNRGC